MSRCFQYTPPGFSGASRDDALIESIKLRKERDKANAERKKEKKREKKERRREEKHKRKENKEKADLDSASKQACKVEKNCALLEGAHGNKRRHGDAEQLERSGLTEEHGEPSQIPCYSSDSTQNSNKRRKHPSPPNGICAQGNIIKIRLPLQKHKEPEATKEWLCSTCVRTDLPTRQECIVLTGDNQQRTTNIPCKNDKELGCSTSGRTEILALGKIQNAAIRTSIQSGGKHSVSTSIKSRGKQRVSSPYTGLFENWVPLDLESKPDFDDQEWLFGTKDQEKHVQKRFKGCTNAPSCGSSVTHSCGSSVLWPLAEYLPQDDIYALPFTVPF